MRILRVVRVLSLLVIVVLASAGAMPQSLSRAAGGRPRADSFAPPSAATGGATDPGGDAGPGAA